MNWKRPQGPSRVWSIVKIIDSNGKNRDFSIQEISTDRYDEVIDHLSNVFLREENMSVNFNVIDDLESISEFQKIWYLILSKGISIAAYDITGNPTKPILAGVNLLVYSEDEKKLKAIKLNGENIKKIFDFASSVSKEADPRKMFKVKGYLSGFGLSVVPKYRGLGLAKILLETRDKIGREYNIEYTSTLFTGSFSQKAAAHVGFQEHLDRDYNEVFDKDGQKLFPKLSGKRFKIMGKFLS